MQECKLFRFVRNSFFCFNILRKTKASYIFVHVHDCLCAGRISCFIRQLFNCAAHVNISLLVFITHIIVCPFIQELEEYVQSSGDDGIIVFSLGTYVHQVRVDFLRPFAEVFGKVRQKVIWQMKGEPLFPLPSNVKTMPWIPQNDLLGSCIAHPYYIREFSIARERRHVTPCLS